MPAEPGATPEAQAPAAVESGHAYSRIALRNAFGIKPPPPPPPVTVPSNPPVTLPMFLTGFSMLKGVKQAYLVVNRPGSKQPDYVTAKEGEEYEGFKVLAIDPKKETVRVVNGATEATLNFKDNGMKASAAPIAPLPGAPNAPGGVPQPRQLGGAAAAGAGGGPTIIGRNNPTPNAAIAAPAASYTVGADNVQPVEIRGRSGVITGAPDPVTPGATTPGGHVPVPVPRTRPAPPPPPLPGQ